MVFSASGSVSNTNESSVTNPWEAQTPYLTGGFEAAQNLLNQGMTPEQIQAIQMGGQASQLAGPIGDFMRQYGQQIAPSLGQATDFYGQVMQGNAGQFTNPYESQQHQGIMQNYWGAPQQMQADALRADTIEGLRRSDWGDALGASLAGVSVGEESSPYLKMRMAAEENATRGYQTQLAGMHDRAFGQATQRANNWAGADMGIQQQGFGNQMAAAGSMTGIGQQGFGLMQQGYGMNQQGAQDMGAWGNYGQGAQWTPLQNYWNVVGSNSWGSNTKSKSTTKSVSGGWG